MRSVRWFRCSGLLQHPNGDLEAAGLDPDDEVHIDCLPRKVRPTRHIGFRPAHLSTEMLFMDTGLAAVVLKHDDIS